MSQNKAQKVMIDARDQEVVKYRNEHPAESYKTIESKGIFKDLKGRVISAQRIHMICKKYEPVENSPLATTL